MTHEPLEQFVELFGGHIYEASKRTGAGRRWWQWRLQQRVQIIDCLADMLPWLTVKRPEAELLGDFLIEREEHRQHGGAMRYSNKDRAKLEHIRKRLRELKQGEPGNHDQRA